MKQKSIVYLILLGSIIVAFFMFTGGITDGTNGIIDLSNFKLNATSPEIYGKLPFSINAFNPNHDKDRDPSKCVDEYYTARDLTGTLEITQQGSSSIISSSSFIFVSETGSNSGGYTGIFVDTISLNYAGNYIATAKFTTNTMPGKPASATTLNFTVGNGSVIPLSAGTYRLSTFKAACASGGGSYTFTNASISNNLIINADGLTASLDINMRMGSNILGQYPCLQDSSYNYSASGNFTVMSNGGSKYFKIEYQNSAFVTFDYSFDGTNLSLGYSKNGSNYELKFIKQ
jgi:hypothetical protein